MTTSATPAAPAMATPTPAQRVLGDLDHEMATTRRVLERVPLDRADWKPHPKSMSVGQLATHLASIPGWGVYTMTTTEMDFAAPLPPEATPPPPTTTEALLAIFDGGVRQLGAALAEATAEELATTWTGRNGDRTVMAMPRAAVLRGFIVSHLIHHRAQLGVYLRLLDVPVPSMYGPTADEPGM